MPKKIVLDDSGYGQSRIRHFTPAVEPEPAQFKKGGKVKRKRRVKTKYTQKQKQSINIKINNNNSRRTVNRASKSSGTRRENLYLLIIIDSQMQYKMD